MNRVGVDLESREGGSHEILMGFLLAELGWIGTPHKFGLQNPKNDLGARENLHKDSGPRENLEPNVPHVEWVSRECSVD